MQHATCFAPPILHRCFDTGAPDGPGSSSHALVSPRRTYATPVAMPGRRRTTAPLSMAHAAARAASGSSNNVNGGDANGDGDGDAARADSGRHEVADGRKAHGGEGLFDATGEPLLHVVFVHPQIHWNTGNIGRTCLGLGARLHLVAPLGFSLEAKQIRRAGLDYWEHVDVAVHASWDAFSQETLPALEGRRYFFSKFGTVCATKVDWRGGGGTPGKTVLVFGSEVDGFDGIRDWLQGEGRDETMVAFPMVDDRFRSFNLSTSASMALWDAYKSIKAGV